MAGNVYVSDTDVQRVLKYSTSGDYLGSIGSPGFGPDQFLYYSPVGIDIGPDGRLYAVDSGNKVVRVFDTDGTYVRSWSTVRPGGPALNNPRAMSIGPDGTLYLIDDALTSAYRFSLDGSSVSLYYTGWSTDYREIHTDPVGNVYALDFDGKLTKRDSGGKCVFQWQASEFSSARGVAVGRDGYIYIADTGNNRIRKFRPAP